MFAQSPGAPQDLYCLWESVSLRAESGKESKQIGVIRFGEVVQYRGASQYVTAESRTYLQVATVDGLTGWVHEYLFVPGLGLGVVTEPGIIYKRPKTVTTVTTDRFEPGDLVVVEAMNGTWIGLSGPQKTKRGWIEGTHKVSMQESDLMLAALLSQIEKEKNPAKQDAQRKELLKIAQGNGSPLAGVIAQRMGLQGSQPTASTRSLQASIEPSLTLPTSTTPPPVPPGQTLVPVTTQTRRFQDEASGRWQTEIIESGGLHLLPASGMDPSIFYAYHKTLPKGSKIRIAIPNNEGFVELVVTDRLASNNPNIIGLSPDCVQAIFGDYVPAEITINYLKR